MKKLFKQIFVLYIILTSMVTIAFLLAVTNEEFIIWKTNYETIRKNCLDSGGTVVEYQGKFERCIPR